MTRSLLITDPNTRALVTPTMSCFGTPAHAGWRQDATCKYSVEVDSMDQSAWERLIATFDDARYDQSHAYAASVWGDGRLSNLVVREGGRTIGAALVVILSLPGIRRGIAYVKFGPLWRRKGGFAAPRHLNAVLAALKEEYAGRRGLMLTIQPPPDALYTARCIAALDEAGFRRRRDMADPNRYLVRLGLSDDELLASFSQSWRSNLKKASRNDIHFHLIEGSQGMDHFMPLYRAMRNRKQYVTPSRAERLYDLFGMVPRKAQPVTIIGEVNGTPTVGAVLGRFGDTVDYLFGATDQRALALRAGYAMQWWIARWLNTEASETRAAWYDLGGEGFSGTNLRQFKKGMTGKQGAAVIMPGEFDYWEGPLARLGGETLFAARHLRDGLASLERSTRDKVRRVRALGR